eukprot:CAMPEP_0174316354 /NCGR_PEP_ID=MMETSP0810-20121108/6872_1 /TAXON_ID=73025 ORGANISM="Eutreptiella gymnastica-like, Strain CCMP1594" /NCGR_SAMPLE_ID=MMETSP0810 /ASSEMBLY_ACC=CAM_ASM_000659 /LENGTH=89 /DNA_ID=CAMNT_0015425995 /DNA_START=677 /DNA_END=947 /DNA_ORIENTATION=-
MNFSVDGHEIITALGAWGWSTTCSFQIWLLRETLWDLVADLGTAVNRWQPAVRRGAPKQRCSLDQGCLQSCRVSVPLAENGLGQNLTCA